MNENIPYNTVLDLLVGDFKSADELAIVLNFLDHTKSMLRLLYWSQKFKNEGVDDLKNPRMDGEVLHQQISPSHTEKNDS